MVGFPKDTTAPENVQPLKTAAAKTAIKKPGPAQALGNLQKSTKPPNTLTMAVDAVRELAGRKGVSVIAIRSHVVSSHPDVDQVRLKRLLKNALAKGLATGVLVRPNGFNPEISPAVGRYKLGKPVATNAKKLKLKAAVVGNVEEALAEARPEVTKKAKALKAVKASAAVTVDTSTKRAKKHKVDLELEDATASSTTASSTNATKSKPAKPKTTVAKKKVVRNRSSVGILTLGSKNVGKETRLNAKAPLAKKTTVRRGGKVLPAVVETGGDESHGTRDANVPKKTKTKVVKTAVVKVDTDAKDKKPRATASKKETAAKKNKS